jgi:hypothetical protein
MLLNPHSFAKGLSGRDLAQEADASERRFAPRCQMVLLLSHAPSVIRASPAPPDNIPSKGRFWVNGLADLPLCAGKLLGPYFAYFDDCIGGGSVAKIATGRDGALAAIVQAASWNSPVMNAA